MKFLASLTLSAALVTTAFAQTILIQSPVNGTTVQAGSNITVEVVQRGSLTPLVQVALVIGLGSPNSAPAIGGNILYNGPFDPEFQNTGINESARAKLYPGLMNLNVAGFDLITEQHFPNTQTVNVTLNVV
ncbi:hypothetical protein B0H14DRAFT_2849672 [Mycena olivaceomarginata]|nr:hypothetical protein B0H14DRAFT_2849672 [Mycena olivaceomarginata]